MVSKFDMEKLYRGKISKYYRISLLSLIGIWLVMLCLVHRPDTFDVNCNSIKVEDWSYVEGEGIMIKFQGRDKAYNIKMTDKEFDLDKMVKNNILDRKTCKVLSNKVK